MEYRYAESIFYLFDHVTRTISSRGDVIGSNFKILTFGKIKFIIFKKFKILFFFEFYQNNKINFSQIPIQVAKGKGPIFSLV